MFSLIVALTMYLAFSPAQPAISASEYRLPEVHAPLPVAAEKMAGADAPVKKDPARLGIQTTAKAVEVVDWKTGAPLFEKNADEPLPIASITKLMTALVVISTKPDWNKEIQMLGSDQRPGGIAYVAPGERVTIDHLLHLSLIASANSATVALARSTGLAIPQFAEKMNQMAATIGMNNSHFVEPSGLDPANVASAHDVALLLKTALANPVIAGTVHQSSYSFTALSGRKHVVASTDELLNSFLSRPPYQFFGGKTGYLDEAGYCLGAAAQHQDGGRVIAVVLGADTKELRFREVKSLIHWAFDAYDWPQAQAVR